MLLQDILDKYILSKLTFKRNRYHSMYDRGVYLKWCCKINVVNFAKKTSKSKVKNTVSKKPSFTAFFASLKYLF